MSKSRLLARILAMVVAIMGAFVLVGWGLDDDKIVKLAEGLAPMAINTALSFMLVGVTLFINSLPDNRPGQNIGGFFLALVGILALLTIIEYVFNINLGIDLMVGDGMVSPNPYQGRMSLLTAFNFLLVSVSLFMDSQKIIRKGILAEFFMVVTLFISVLALSGIVFGATHYFSYITTMALHTTVGFVVVVLAYFSLHAKEGLAALIISNSLAGKLIRSILVPLVLIFPMLAMIGLWGERAGFYNAEGRTVFMMIASLGFFSIIVLVSARMVSRLDLEKGRYQKFFELSSEMLIIAGTDGYIKRASSAFTKVLGYSLSEAQTIPYIEFIHPDDRAMAQKELKKVGAGLGVSKAALRLKSKTGLTKHFLWSITPNMVNGELFAAGYDITEIKEAEQLRALAEKLSQQNKQLASFAHIVSHNLRSPAGNLSALIDLYKIAANQSERDNIVEKFAKVSEHLNSTLNDLVETLRVKEDIGKERETLLFSDVLEKTKEILTGQILASTALVTHNFNRQPQVLYPRIYLESIFLNLLSNALKYRSPNRVLKVHFETLEINRNLVLTVEDNGQGIDLAKYGDKIFGFYKAFHIGKESKGMGLFLTKTQIEAMGGTISVRSEVGKGTVFTITFGKVGNK